MSIAEELFFLFDKEDKFLGKIMLQVGGKKKSKGDSLQSESFRSIEIYSKSLKGRQMICCLVS